MWLHVVVELHFEEVLGLYLSHVVDNELVVEKISFKIRILDANADGNLEINEVKKFTLFTFTNVPY